MNTYRQTIVLPRRRQEVGREVAHPRHDTDSQPRGRDRHVQCIATWSSPGNHDRCPKNTTTQNRGYQSYLALVGQGTAPIDPL